MLAALYGPSNAGEIAQKIAAQVERFRRASPSQSLARAAAGFTERDAILIAYADQVHESTGAPTLATLRAFAQTRLRDVVSGIHLLPFYPWSSDDGFAVKDYFAVAEDYGTWDDIRRLGEDFDLMFDAVFNHLSAQSEWFRRFLADDPAFRDFFVAVQGTPDLSAVVRPRALPLLTEFPSASGPRRVWTTFGPDQVDLNFQNPAVLLAVLDALLFYVAQGARFIRLDAIAFLWKEVGTDCLHRPQTHQVIQLMRAVLDEVAPHVALITETNVPHCDNLSYFGDGSSEAQFVYNFALPPLVLHAMQSGRAETLTRWAQSLALPSERVTFFNFLASHDGIGLNPVRGLLPDVEIDGLVQRTQMRRGFVSNKRLPNGSQAPYELNINYLDALAQPGESMAVTVRRFATAHAIMFCLQGMPGVYFHSLFGSQGDQAGAESSGIKRRINREKLPRARLEAELAEPSSLRAQVFTALRALLEFRGTHAAFAPAAPQRVLDLDPRVFAVLREDRAAQDRILCLHNVSRESVTVETPGVDRAQHGLEAGGCRWISLP